MAPPLLPEPSRAHSAWVAESVAFGVVAVRIGHRFFGFPIRAIREIAEMRDLTRVLLAPPAVVGLVNLRGQVVTVLDIRKELGLAREDLPSQAKLLVLKRTSELAADFVGAGLTTSEEKVAILVDDVFSVQTPRPEDFEAAPPSIDERQRSSIYGVSTRGKQEIVCLVLPNLIEPPKAGRWSAEEPSSESV